jgi:Quinolinate synthetase A protein
MVALKEGYDLASEVRRLKIERRAVILAHNYQVPEIQDVADFVGDSLGLSYRAKEADADVIVFCGVHFMAETAKIINPTKKVILPDLEAGCSLADSCPADQLEAFLQKHSSENYYVIAYINCSAGVCAGSKSWLLGHGEDRPKNGSVARSLLRARRVYSKQYQRDPRSVSRRSGCRASGMHLCGSNAGGRSLLDREDGEFLPVFDC